MKNFSLNRQAGLALLMAIFVICLASIIVISLSYQSRFDARGSRAFVESIQADYILKSGINVGKVLINLPKRMYKGQPLTGDSLIDIWAQVGTMENLNSTLSGVVGDVKLEIIDEDGKLDLNSIVASQTPTQRTPPPPTRTPPPGDQNQPRKPADFYLEALTDLFKRLGFALESYDEVAFRTLGNVAYDAATQAATVHDWIDTDRNPKEVVGGQGMESSLPKEMFYNRKLNSFSEILLIPGMTLERLGRLAPFVTVGNQTSTNKQININTAPRDVLAAIGFDDTEIETILQARETLPISTTDFNTMVVDPTLKKYSKLNSGSFSIYVRVRTSNAVRWAKAIVSAPYQAGSPLTPHKNPQVIYKEFY